MRAVLADDGLQIRADYPAPVPSDDQALLKIRTAGICNTDMELINGYMNFRGVLGHEFVAEVTAGRDGWSGQRVVGEINVACGACDLCGRGIPSQCRYRTTVGLWNHPGAFADQLALTVRNLHVVPDSVSDDQAVFTEPLAAALQVTALVPVSPRDRVVLIGAGKLGLLCAQVLKLTGCDLSVVVRREAPARLLNRWGIRAVGRDEVPPARAQVVVDCTGTSEGFREALDMVEPRGTVILKSTYVGLPQADLTRVAVDEVRVVGSRCGPFPAALRLMAQGLIDTDSLIDARYRLDDAAAAFASARRPGALKVLLDVV
jgi:threonine dehydrogenase-like Zn-dependent dehydrogenase